MFLFALQYLIKTSQRQNKQFTAGLIANLVPKILSRDLVLDHFSIMCFQFVLFMGFALVDPG